LVERVEYVKKFLLRTLLAGKKLNIVHQQQIARPKPRRELLRGLVLQRVYEIQKKLFGRYVGNGAIRIVGNEIITNRLQQMRFSQSHPAVNKQRIKPRLSRRSGDSHGGAMGELAVGPYNKFIQSEPLV
jgi:hypothetical protein